MIVAITGTPGTGKTSVARELKWETIDLTKFIEEKGLGEEEEGEIEVEVDELVEELEKEVDRDADLVIEGHLAHHFPADYCVVLRCRPETLRGRLSERDYTEEKINRNVESEALDLILSEAVETQDKIIEIDTTDKSAEETAREIKNRIERGKTGYGDIDWSEYL